MLASEILGMISSDKQKSIVEQAYSQNKDAIRSFYRKSVRSFKGNFTDIRRVPDFLILVRAKEDSKSYSDLGQEVIKLWYDANQKLCETVSDALKKCGYEPKPHDFSQQEISWSGLDDKDIFVDENGLYYFAPDKKYIDGFDPVDATIMAVLLGWSQASNEENEE